jgi:hypothetical protein
VLRLFLLLSSALVFLSLVAHICSSLTGK